MSRGGLALHPFLAPRSLDELLEILARRGERGEASSLLAGGTDWFVDAHGAPPLAPQAPLPLVLDVSRLPELKGVEVEGDGAWIGLGTTYLELRSNPFVLERLPLLSAMARDVGALQIQARGTLGGNLSSGSPAADGVAALAALDATIELASVSGRRLVPLSGFYTGYRSSVRRPDEVLTRARIIVPASNSAWTWRKVGTRRAQAISKVALAAVAELTEGRLTRVGLGMASVAPVVSFLPSVRTLVTGQAPGALDLAELDAATGADISPIDDLRSTAAYRRHVARQLVRGFFRSLAAG